MYTRPRWWPAWTALAVAGVRTKEIRTFATMPDNLAALHDCLLEAGVTQVAMESTGVTWKPVYAVLEDDIEVIVANAQHIRPGDTACRVASPM